VSFKGAVGSLEQRVKRLIPRCGALVVTHVNAETVGSAAEARLLQILDPNIAPVDLHHRTLRNRVGAWGGRAYERTRRV
jgi:hypothetical protein